MRVSSRHNDGFTLLELMFASGVLALALSLLFGSLITINIVGRISENRTVAASELASLLEEARTLSLQELMSYTPPALHGPGVEQAVQLDYFDAGGNAVSLPLEAEDEIPTDLPNPLEIRATLAWTDDNGRAYSMSAVTKHGR